MRQEKTMKVIANHFLDPRIVLTPNVGTDKSWVWGAFDFSDNELVEQVKDKSLNDPFNLTPLITTYSLELSCSNSSLSCTFRYFVTFEFFVFLAVKKFSFNGELAYLPSYLSSFDSTTFFVSNMISFMCYHYNRFQYFFSPIF